MDYDRFGVRDSDLVIEKLKRQMNADKITARKWNSLSAALVCAALLMVIVLELEDISMGIVTTFTGISIVAFLTLNIVHRRGIEKHTGEKEIDPYRRFLLKGTHGGEDGAAAIATTLSRREIQILQLIAEGNINKQIARELGLSPATVRNHVSRLMQKLEVNDRTAAAVMALSNGWINIEGQPRHKVTLKTSRHQQDLIDTN